MLSPRSVSGPEVGVKLRRWSAPWAWLLGVLLLAASCGSDSGERETSKVPEAFHAADIFTFSDLPRMVATADVVVLATVAEVQPGRTVGPAGQEVQYVDTTLIPEKVLRGTVSASELTAETLQLEVYEIDWRQPGERVVAFLSISEPEANGRFHPTNSQSIFVLDAGNNLEPTVDDTFAQSFAGLSIEQFIEQISRANRAIERGNVSPEPPLGRE